ncbi:Hpt domain-containing protein [Sulfurovum sp. CS9]|uniref:Hpt domain-containing protein n=1 Tax=Sulfurovum sp. CS9 TaxID=3391146 RepID=UPI0039ED12AF
MIGYIIISVFVLILILFVYIEYKNEKKYQEERRQKRQNVKKEEKKPVIKPKKVPSAKELEEKEVQEKRAEQKKRLEEQRLQEQRLEEQRLEEKRLQEKKLEPELTPKPVVTEKPKTIAISLGKYPKFDHSRLLEMGLSEEEAKEFVAELIPQIETQIPLIKEAMAISDFHNMERLIHSIKGSSTTVGTGGVSDLLVDYNTYLKTGTELAIAEAYLEQLKHYCEELKEQYA